MQLDICRDESCRREKTDQRNPHALHGGDTIPVTLTIIAIEDARGRRSVASGRRLYQVHATGGIWPSDTTLLDACAGGRDGHSGGTVTAHADGDDEVEVALYPA